MQNLDRFSQGLADSQDADFWECRKCYKEVYEETEHCPHCAGERLQSFRKALRAIEAEHRVTIENECGGAYLVDGESGEEEEL